MTMEMNQKTYLCEDKGNFSEWMKANGNLEELVLKGLLSRMKMFEINDILKEGKIGSVDIEQCELLVEDEDWEQFYHDSYAEYLAADFGLDDRPIPMLLKMFCDKRFATRFVIRGEWCFSEDGKVIVAAGKVKEYVIPEGTECVGDFAFFQHDFQRVPMNVVFPDSLKEIGVSAFEGCELSSVILPDSVEKLGDSSFCYCDITELKLPSHLEVIPLCCFRHATLEHLDFPPTLKVMEGGNAIGVEKVIFPEGMERIEEDALSFYELRYIHFPSTMKYIDKNFFYEALVIDYPFEEEYYEKIVVDVHPDNPWYYSRYGQLFRKTDGKCITEW